MIVYTPNITPRLQYAAKFIFNNLGLNFELSSDAKKVSASNNLVINYSSSDIENSFKCEPYALLFENNISEFKPEISYLGELPVYFKTKVDNLGFDIFSAVFWFLSRYEEYQPNKGDHHNRFQAAECLAFKHKILSRPIVDEWIQYFGGQLQKFFPEIVFDKKKFTYLTTIDIDSPWCYKNKGFVRNIGGVVRDLLKWNIREIGLRVKVLLGVTDDPWDKFSWIYSVQQQFGFSTKYFLHVGDYDTFDKTVSYKKNEFKKLVAELSLNNSVALHPSYKAHNNNTTFITELVRLSNLLNNQVIESRQHYLVYKLPNYYEMLEKLGIAHDFSMGYADRPGFRAGTCRAHYFYNLSKEKETSLMVHPFVVMDRTLNSYENATTDEALLQLKKLISNVKNVNGTFISLWHNESLSERFEWKGWQKVFIDMHKLLND